MIFELADSVTSGSAIAAALNEQQLTRRNGLPWTQRVAAGSGGRHDEVPVGRQRVASRGGTEAAQTGHMLGKAMPLIDLTVPHGRTIEEARQRLETAVHQVCVQFGAVIRRAEWAPDRNRVKLEGVGIRVEIWVDAREVHAMGDIPLLGALLGGPLASGLKQIIQETFQKRLP